MTRVPRSPAPTTRWTATSAAPDNRSLHTAVWTGSEMIVWGGVYNHGGISITDNTGGRYNPSTNSWTAMSTTNAPTARSNHTAVWTGSEMIVWGGYVISGTFRTPAADTIRARIVGPPPAPLTRPLAETRHTAVWTGSEMIVWGGYDGTGSFQHRRPIQSRHEQLDGHQHHQRARCAETITRQSGPAVK